MKYIMVAFVEKNPSKVLEAGQGMCSWYEGYMGGVKTIWIKVVMSWLTMT